MLYYAFTDDASYPTGPLDGCTMYWKMPYCFVYIFNQSTYALHTHIIQVEVIGSTMNEDDKSITTDRVYVHSVEPLADWINKQSEAMQIMCVRKSIATYELIREPSDVLRKEKEKSDQRYFENRENEREKERERENMSRLNRCVIV
jgi:hypothetical protein